MSYLPNIYELVAVSSFSSFAVYTAQIALGNYDSTTGTTSSFVVPALHGTVTVQISGTLNASVGDHVVIGDFAGYYKTGLVTSNPVTLTAYRMGNWLAGSNLGSGYYLKAPSGQSTAITGSLTASLPNARNQSSFSVTVATIGVVPSNNTVCVGRRAGTYRITSINSSTSVTLQKICDGEIPAGQTAVSGLNFTAGSLLGITPDIGNALFCPVDAWWSCRSLGAISGSNQALVSIGYSAQNDGTRDYYGDLVDGYMMPLEGSFGTPPTYRPLPIRNQSVQRLGIPKNTALMAYVSPSVLINTAIGITICVRGFYSEV